MATGKITRLMVFLPPRHGKSELISKYFPAWYLGKKPDNRIILASYEADFAASWGRKARDLLEEYGADFFNVRIRSDSSDANRWDLQGNDGRMVTVGVGGPITGKGPYQPKLFRDGYDRWHPRYQAVETKSMGLTLYQTLVRQGLPVRELAAPDALESAEQLARSSAQAEVRLFLVGGDKKIISLPVIIRQCPE